MSFTLPAIPEFHLPGWLKRINQRLPQWPHAIPLCLGLNLGLKLETLPPEIAELCEGKTVRVLLEDGGSEAVVACRNGVFRPRWRKVDSDSGNVADITFRGELHAYLKLITRQEDPDTLFFNRQIAIEGDTELGLGIKNLLDTLEWPPAVLATLKSRLERVCERAAPQTSH
ncbi:MAG: SCP2 sterol-binding domain-containing protein [Zoogloeaceae bacterium]|jgi:predicted lipid carrier protein YhbT|nr:SCP2 sterol-binding domain-containing protein [Zoogloeaceae bacterium]